MSIDPRPVLTAAAAIVAIVAMTAPDSAVARADAEGDALAEAVSACRAIGDDDRRLECYDELAPSQASVDEPVAAVSEAPATPPAEPEEPAAAPPRHPAPISDDVGFASDEDDEPEYAVRVTQCQEAARGQQLFFHLDNGQVWKQTDYRRLRLRECDFDAVIVKGSFGFRMQMPDIDRTVRVSRVR